PALETATANSTGVIAENQIQHMPSFGRDVFQLAQLAPGAFGDGSQGSGGGGFSLPGTQGPGGTSGTTGIFATENGPQVLARGGQYENNGYSIDGISTTSAVWGGTTVITPSEDSVQTVKVTPNAYDAEIGRFAGASVEVTSKSGSNNFHGSMFYTAHRAGLNAYQRWNGPSATAVQRDENRWNQFGGSVGFPIWKNKVFGFFAWETVRQPLSPTSTTGWYETSAFEGLAKSGSIASTYLGLTGNKVSYKSINSISCANIGLTEGSNCRTLSGGLDVGSPLTTALGTQDTSWVSAASPGLGAGLDGIADIANYNTVSPTTATKNQYNGRLDANVTSKDHLGFAIYWVPQSNDSLNGTARGYNYFHHSQINEAFSLIWNHTFSPTFLNEARFNAAGWHWDEIASNPQQPQGLPQDNIGNIGSASINAFGAIRGSILKQWTYSYKDVATKIIGNHTVKFGGEATRLYYLNDDVWDSVPGYTFFNMWDFLNDAPKEESAHFNPTTGKPTMARQDDRTTVWGFFLHDDWKVKKNLTVNMGLRWSYFGPLTSKQGNMYVATIGAGSAYMTGLTVARGASWNTQKGNFGPQIGFAWSPAIGKDKLVVRGGYGLNYNQEEIAISANINSNPGLSVAEDWTSADAAHINSAIYYALSSNLYSQNGYPSNSNAILSFGSNGLPTSGAVSVGLFPHNLPTMLTHHYSLDAQYDLGHNWVASLGYMGSASRNTYFHSNPNAIPAALGYTLNSAVSGGDFWGVNGSGNYNAMLAEVKHNFSQHFQADAQYTWSKAMDTSSAPYSEQNYVWKPSYNYGPSDYNVAQAFKLFGVYQPVIFHGQNGWLEKVAGGWSLSGIWNWHTGFPWSPTYGLSNSMYCATCGYYNINPSSYLHKPGSSTSNSAFEKGSNFANNSTTPYFGVPSNTSAFTYSSGYGSALPPKPGVGRNSQIGPHYKDVDLTISKAFGLPKEPVLGENAKFEFRADIYNLFNNVNINPSSITSNISLANLGQASSALAGRTVTLGMRFEF
ncbi:MAG: carboxypeptidase regulatory-like domain-containing protein, partial [Acidobacteriota bacterium]|nr:carboxypeptidase regulatory-like domain-containing protein [Acidobacteriota bacterium]